MASWTVEEDSLLKELYETASKELILSKFPSRDWRSVYKRSVILNLHRPEEGSWTKEDDTLLKEIYSSNTHEFMLSKFSGRTWKAIRWRANNILGLVRDEQAVQKATRQTNQEHRGTDYPTQAISVKNKIKESVQKKYGVDNVFQSEEIKQKIIKKNIEIYGVKSPTQSDTVKELENFMINKICTPAVERISVKKFIKQQEKFYKEFNKIENTTIISK